MSPRRSLTFLSLAVIKTYSFWLLRLNPSILELQPRLTKSLGAPSTGHWGLCCQLSAPPPCPPLSTASANHSQLPTCGYLLSSQPPPLSLHPKSCHQTSCLLLHQVHESHTKTPAFSKWTRGWSSDLSRQVAVSNHDPCPRPSLQGQEALEIRNRQDLIFQNKWWGREWPHAAAHLTGHRGRHRWVPGPGSTHCPQSHAEGIQMGKGTTEAPIQPGVSTKTLCFKTLGLVSLNQFLNYAFCGRCF